MHYRVCTHCNTVILSGKRACPACKAPLGAGSTRDVKLCQHDGTPIALDGRFCTTCGILVRDRSLPLWIWWIALLLVSALSAFLLSQLHQYVSTTYRPMSCLIDGTSVSYHSTKNGSYYEPDIAYEVIGANGQHIASGEDTMGLGHYDDSSSAQAVVDQYQTGSTYACWYSTIASPGALLVSPGERQNTGFLVIFWFVCSGGLGLLAFWLVRHTFLYPRQLRKRGVTAYGTVVDHETQRSRNGTTTYSIVKFQTQTDPPLFCRVKKQGREALHSTMSVLYDPLNPARNARIGNGGMGCTITVFLFIFLIGAGVLVWQAFSF
jgi:uncharacterized protein DUF3592